METEWLGPIMFGVVFALIFSGYPVAFSLGGTSYFRLGWCRLGCLRLGSYECLSGASFRHHVEPTLLAIPFFIFMGTVLEKSKLAEDLLTTVGALFGGIRGGLALAVVFVGALLAAATGVVGASVVAMGLISLPVMVRYGYSKELAAGVITASGTLGQIIPPSVVLIVLADQLGQSVGDLFMGALIPGLLLAGCYGLYVLFIAWRNPEAAPALPEAERAERGLKLLKRVMLVLLPPLSLILVVLGSIIVGLATPTEAGALGAVGALLLAQLNGRLNHRSLHGAMDETTRLSAMILMLLIGSTLFALVFRGLDGDRWIEHFLTHLPGGAIGLLIVANLTVFVLGFFIDFFEIAFIILPLIVPAAVGLEIDMVWFGVLLAINLQTSFLTPPFGFSLFYLRGVAPASIETTAIYRGALPFIGIQLLVLSLVIAFPGLVRFLLTP